MEHPYSGRLAKNRNKLQSDAQMFRVSHEVRRTPSLVKEPGTWDSLWLHLCRVRGRTEEWDRQCCLGPEAGRGAGGEGPEGRRELCVVTGVSEVRTALVGP